MARCSFVLGAIVVFAVGAHVVAAGPKQLTISASGNGTCVDDSTGDSWLYRYSDAVPAGRFSALPGDLFFQLDLRSERRGNPPLYSNASLGHNTTAVVENPRGAVRLSLTAGDCRSRPLQFDGTTVTGNGTWSLAAGTAAYRDATGGGTFTLTALVDGGPAPFVLDLHGTVDVLAPSLVADLAGAGWMRGSKAESRVADVSYRLLNAGPGDAFNLRLDSAVAGAPGVMVMGTFPQELGHLAAGSAASIRVQYELAPDACRDTKPHCAFTTTLSLHAGDALDSAVVSTPAVEVRVPAAP